MECEAYRKMGPEIPNYSGNAFITWLVITSDYNTHVDKMHCQPCRSFACKEGLLTPIQIFSWKCALFWMCVVCVWPVRMLNVVLTNQVTRTYNTFTSSLESSLYNICSNGFYCIKMHMLHVAMETNSFMVTKKRHFEPIDGAELRMSPSKLNLHIWTVGQ